MRYFLVLTVVLAAVNSAGNECRSLFAARDINKSIQSLAGLRFKLDMGLIHGGDSIAFTALKNAYQAKEADLLKYVTENQLMTRVDFYQEIRQEIRNLSKVDKENLKEREKFEELQGSLVDGTKARFHRIEPGSYQRGEITHTVSERIDKAFEMMATPVTQILWQRVADLGALKYDELKYRQLVGHVSAQLGNLKPVEYLSGDFIILWIELLNKLSADGEPRLKEIIPDYQKGQKFRLPSTREWEFVATACGTLNKLYYFANTKAELSRYTHILEERDVGTYDVATTDPLLVGNMEFFDLLGNVSHWVGEVNFRKMELVGAGWDNAITDYVKGIRWNLPSSDKYPDAGFRLVREVP